MSIVCRNAHWQTSRPALSCYLPADRDGRYQELQTDIPPGVCVVCWHSMDEFPDEFVVGSQNSRTVRINIEPLCNTELRGRPAGGWHFVYISVLTFVSGPSPGNASTKLCKSYLTCPANINWLIISLNIWLQVFQHDVELNN